MRDDWGERILAALLVALIGAGVCTVFLGAWWEDPDERTQYLFVTGGLVLSGLFLGHRDKRD